MIRRHPPYIVAAGVGAAALLCGCVHPLSRDMEQALHDQLLGTQRAYRDALRDARSLELTRPANLVTEDVPEERRRELEAMSGQAANRETPLDVGPDLTGRPTSKMVAMSLQRALELAIRHNRDLRLARLVPAVRDVQMTQAEAVFDAVAFANLDFQKLDTPRPTSSIDSAFGSQQQDTRDLTLGIRKLMSTGGQISASTNMTRTFSDPSLLDVQRFYDTDVTLNVVQPLLRNFGSDVTRSQIMLATNAKDQGMADLKDTLLDVAAATEQAYWELVLARDRLLIVLRLLTEAERAHNVIWERRLFDAAAVEISQIRAFVAERRLDVIEARRALRQSSDQLKQLLYAPDLPLSGEELIDPLDTFIMAPMQYDLLDAVNTALQHRPDLERALSEIGDATIRQRVADNQRLPLLDLSASLRYNGVGVGSVGSAQDDMLDGDFIDYLLSLQFEMPIGNRAAEAVMEQRKIERRGAVINYQRLAQAAIFEVKSAVHVMASAYQSIGTALDARLAAADTVRALQAQWEAGQDLTPNFVDLFIRRREDLSQNEIREARAQADYNIAIARYYQTLGTLLERNGVEVTDQPEP